MNINIRISSLLVLTAVGLSGLPPLSATADDGGSERRACAVHAAAMVAEMKAGAASPLSEQELGLVRQTALKSCLTQAPAAAAAPAVPIADPVAATAPARRDTSFWGTLAPILGGDGTRSAGNERLMRRSRH